jgi:hypothetical protein
MFILILIFQILLIVIYKKTKNSILPWLMVFVVPFLFFKADDGGIESDMDAFLFLIIPIIWIIAGFWMFISMGGTKEDVNLGLRINKICPYCMKKLPSYLTTKCPHCTADL